MIEKKIEIVNFYLTFTWKRLLYKVSQLSFLKKEYQMLAVEAHKEIEKQAAKTTKKQVVKEFMKDCDHVRQGDIYVVKIPAITGSKEIANRQLAPGNTKGSRHVVHGSVKIFDSFVDLQKLFKSRGFSVPEIPDFCKGPQICADKSFSIKHPEHADFILPAGNFQVLYQCDWMRQERVRD